MACASSTEREDKGTVIGIDLGTTFTCVGVYNHGRVEIIENRQTGRKTTPSCIAINKNKELLIGDAAKKYLLRDPTSTAYNIKRFIGREWHDKTIQNNKDQYPFQVVEEKNRPCIKLSNEEKPFKPEEISAMLLRRMKENAEDYLSETVTKAVITVPAYFNDAQRQATKDAGTIAGLDVLRIINEPTAAAIAYGFDKRISNEKILVFDLGGGTFDVTLLSIDDGDFTVLGTNGNTQLGGEDFNQNVVESFISNYHLDIMHKTKDMQKLRREVETAKQELTNQFEAEIYIEDLNSREFAKTLRRATFEELNKNLFDQTMDKMREVLEEGDVLKNLLSEIVLVGGSTRIPKVQSMIQEFFNGKEPKKNINPDEAVAYGAAVLAGTLGNRMAPGVAPRIIDVNSLSLGVNVMGGLMVVIIPRNTPLPVVHTSSFETSSDDQTSIRIGVYEGERPMYEDNHLLGEFYLNDIPPAPRGEQKFDTTFEIKEDGILFASAELESGGKTRQLQINNESRYSATEITKMVDAGKRYFDEDKRRRELAEYRNDLDNYIYKVRKQKDEDHAADRLRTSDKTTIEKFLDDHKIWENSNPKASLAEYKTARQRLECMVDMLMTFQ